MMTLAERAPNVTQNGVLIGHGWKGVRPNRDMETLGTKLGRWLVPGYMYSGSTFPEFVSGLAYILNRAAVKCILEVTSTIFIPKEFRWIYDVLWQIKEWV